MKKLLACISSLLLILTACAGSGSNTTNDDADLSPKERDALRHVKRHLNKKEKLVDYEFVEGPMPVELMTDEYKRYRDDVYKTGLDYVNCIKRGLEEAAQDKATKLLRYQEEIIVKTHEWEQEQGTSEYLFVLATVEDTGKPDKPISKWIAVFNPVTMQRDFMFPLTTPFVNNASMILSAENGSLFEYATDPAYNAAALTQSLNNPILNFIFDADPSTIK